MESNMVFVKRTTAILLLAVLISGGLSGAEASAHVLETDKGVSAILHIKPDDRPVASEPTVVRFLFSRDAGSFRINDYDVKLLLFQDTELTSKSDVEPAFFGANAEGGTTITFPEAGIYKLQVEGTPTKDGVLPFKLDFTARVTGPAETKTGNGSTPIIIGGFSLAILGVVAAKGIKSGGRYRQKTKS